jgi:3-methyladenine DNA glycosylase AlkD
MDIQPLIDAMESGQDFERAAQIKRYMKTEMDTIGLTMAELRSATKNFVKTLRQQHDWNAELSRQLVSELWSQFNWTMRQSAIEVLVYDIAYHKKDAAASLKYCEEVILPKLDGWALTDVLATKVLPFLVPNPQYLLNWLNDDSFWIRRCSLLAQFPQIRKMQADLEVHQQCVDHLIDDKEWFIQKAIGWSLRTIGYKQPEWVLSFVEDRPNMSKFAKKEALRRII